MIKSMIISLIKGACSFLVIFLVLGFIFVVIQPLFPPIVSIILGFAVVFYTGYKFFRTTSRISQDIIDGEKTVDKSSPDYIYLEIKKADELNREWHLDKAIEKYKAVLKKVSKGSSPEVYAHINFNLGAAYTKLSEERDGEENTSMAILAYEECLEFYSIEKAPIDYAMAQCELGYSYGKLSGPGDKEAYTLIAASAYEKALKVYTAEKYPLHYAAIQNNMGNLYGSLITSMDQRDYYHKAFSAYNEALKFITEDINPETFRLIKDNFARTNLRFVSPDSDVDFQIIRIVRDLDKIIMVDYRREAYLRRLRPVVKRNFYHLNEEELHKLCIPLTDLSKAMDDYFYSPEEMVDALYSYMEFAKLNTENVFGDVNKALEYFRTVYKWAPPEVESYRERLKPLIEKRYGYLKPYEQGQLCKTITQVAKSWDNYGHSPEEMLTAIEMYKNVARIDIKDVIGDIRGTTQYLTEIYK